MTTNDIEFLNTHYPGYIQQAGRDFTRNFILLTLDSSAFTFALAMLSQDTILPYFVSLLTSSSALIGLVAAVFFLGYYAPQLFGAYLASQRSRRKPLILAIVIAQRVGILMIALTAQAAGRLSPTLTLVLFFISYAVFSILNGLISPAYSDFISKHIIRRRGLYYGVSYGVGGLIGLLASLVSRYYLDLLPFPGNFQTIFWLGFVSSFISPFIVANFRETPLPGLSPAEPLKTYFKNMPGYIRSQPLFVRYLSARAFLGLGLMGNTFYAIYAIRHFTLSQGSLGLFTMVILLAQSALGFVWGWIGDHFGYKAVLQIAGLFLLAEALLALLAPGAWAFFVIAFLVGGVYSASWITDPNFIFEVAPPHETSRYIGIANTLLAPVGVVAPLLGGILVDSLGYPALFAGVLVTAVLCLVAAWRWVREPRRKPGLVSQP